MKTLTKIIQVVAVGFLLSLLLASSACNSSPSSTIPAPASATTSAPSTSVTSEPVAQVKDGGTLRLVASGSLTQIGYTPTMSGAMGSFVDFCYEGLIWQNMLTGEVSPLLAESWDPDPAGKFFTLHLRKNVKFHDGTDFNAQSLKDFLVLKQKAVPNWLGNVTSMDVIDQNTLKLNTTNINLIFYANLTEQISSPTHLAKGPDAIAYEPVGTGPFKFAEYKRDAYLKFQRFDSYWGNKPHLNGIEWIFVPDSATQVATFLGGEAEYLHTTESKDVDTLKAAGATIHSIPTIYNGFVPDTTNPDSPFANKKVREAVAYAINREDITKNLGYGFMQPHDELIPKGVAGYDPNLAFKYDQVKAKQLLAEAGYPNGFETTIIASPFAVRDTIVAVQSNLADIGIKAKVDFADMGKYMSLRTTGWNNGLLFLHAMYGQPYEYYLYRTWAAEYKDWVSAKRPNGFDDLLSKMIAEMDISKRTAMVQQAAKLVHDDVMYIPVLTRDAICATSSKVQDIGIYKESGIRFALQKYNIWLSK